MALGPPVIRSTHNSPTISEQRSAWIEKGIIYNVDLKNFTVDVISDYESKIFTDCQIASPYFHTYNGEGIFAMPEVGSACLICQPSDDDTPFVLAFIGSFEIEGAKQANLEDHVGEESTETEDIQTTDLEFDIIPNIVQPKSKKAKNVTGTIYIVSGLPRSGTSMMMQMLEKAGLDILTDKIRKPDESNPKGYYEHEEIKKLATNKKWLKNAVGKTIKVIAQLLLQLPAKYHYKIIFMNRDIDEVVKSQHKMLVSKGKAKEDTFPVNLKITFVKTIKKVQFWANKNHNVEILYMNHKDLIEQPEKEALKIIEFLNLDIDSKKIASVIDKKLYRTKK